MLDGLRPARLLEEGLDEPAPWIRRSGRGGHQRLELRRPVARQARHPGQPERAGPGRDAHLLPRQGPAGNDLVDPGQHEDPHPSLLRVQRPHVRPPEGRARHPPDADNLDASLRGRRGIEASVEPQEDAPDAERAGRHRGDATAPFGEAAHVSSPEQHAVHEARDENEREAGRGEDEEGVEEVARIGGKGRHDPSYQRAHGGKKGQHREEGREHVEQDDVDDDERGMALDRLEPGSPAGRRPRGSDLIGEDDEDHPEGHQADGQTEGEHAVRQPEVRGGLEEAEREEA